LCADTQETFEYTKTNVPKLRFEQHKNKGEKDHADDLVIAMAGAGNGPFIDKLADRAWEDVQAADSFDGACLEIEESIKRTHKEFGQIFQTGYLPEARLVYAVKMQGDTKLFRAHGPLVSEHHEWTSDGTGHYLANFIGGRMYNFTLSLSQLTILAAYTIFQAKEFVDGCGGETHVAVLKNEGGSARVREAEIKWIEQHIQTTDWFLDDILLKNADLDLGEKELEEAYAQHLNFLKTARMNHVTSKVQTDAFIQMFTEAGKRVRAMRSASQKSEPKP